MSFDFDGKSLLNIIFEAQAKKDGNEQVVQMIKIFDKYGVSFTDGISMLLELASVIGGDK